MFAKRPNCSEVRKYLDVGTILVLLALHSSTLVLKLNHDHEVKMQTATLNLNTFTSMSGDTCLNHHF